MSEVNEQPIVEPVESSGSDRSAIDRLLNRAKEDSPVAQPGVSEDMAEREARYEKGLCLNCGVELVDGECPKCGYRR